jgi:hypothetical protein
LIFALHLEQDVDSIERPACPHRRNPDESFDSICPDCFATIARTQNEAELARHERNHLCRAEDLDRFRAMRKAPARTVHPKKMADGEPQQGSG